MEVCLRFSRPGGPCINGERSLDTEKLEHDSQNHVLPIILLGFFQQGFSFSGDGILICRKEVTSFYEPVEKRNTTIINGRLGLAEESRGLRHRLRLVVQLFPATDVIDIGSLTSQHDNEPETKTLKDQLDKCLKGNGEKALLDSIKEAFRSRNESLEEDAAELEDRLRSCTRSSVPEQFDASIEFVYNCKVTGWRR